VDPRGRPVLRWDEIGSIEPGKHADLVITDRDPLSCSLQDLAGTRVVTAMLGGRTVHGVDPIESSLAPLPPASGNRDDQPPGTTAHEGKNHDADR
jgi:hypothetical protein